MSNLIVVCVRDGDQRTFRIFNEDTELSALDSFVIQNRSKGFYVSELFIYGMAVEPLRQYLQNHPLI